MSEWIYLALGLILCVWMPIEARRVRDGWMRKSFKGTHAAFVAKYRRQLAWIGWSAVAVGVVRLVFAAIIAREPSFFLQLATAVVWLAAGGLSLWSRRRLGGPRSA